MRRLFLCILALILLLPLLTSSCSGLALIHIKQGDGYAAKGQTAQAIAEYGKAIELNPKAAAAYCGRGSVYFEQSQWTSAIDDLSTAVELDPNLAANLNPKRITAYYNRGQDYNESQRYDLAVLDLSKAIELDPDSASARMYSERGKANLELGKIVPARNDYNRVMELDPELLTGKELADIIFRCSSSATTGSIDEDVIITLEISGVDIDTATISKSGTVRVTMPMQISGVFDITNKKIRAAITFAMDIVGNGKYELNCDMYVIDGWAYMHMKDSKTEGWFKSEMNDTAWEIQDQLSQQRELLETAIDITLLGSEKVDDVDCYILLFKPDMAEWNKYIGDMLSQQKIGIGLGNPDFSKLIKTIEIKEWINKDDYLPLKIEENACFDTTFYDATEHVSSVMQNFSFIYLHLSGSIAININFRDFNQPVVIELPPEALQAKEIYSVY
jgi:tetratricopeptide (TPR) repeat protein